MQPDRGFITLFPAYHWSFSRARWRQSTSSHTIPVTFSLILSFHLRVNLPSRLFLSDFPINRYMCLSKSPSLPLRLGQPFSNYASRAGAMCVATNVTLYTASWALKVSWHSRVLNDKTSNSHLEGDEEALGSCTRALCAVEEPHSSLSGMTSESVYLHVIATNT